MRRLLIVLVAGAVLLAPVSTAYAWQPGREAAVEYAHSRAGRISFAVMNERGRMFRYRARRQFESASVIKAMFLVAYLRQRSVRARELTSEERHLLSPMIRRSDNDAATAIANRLGPARIYRLARDARMRRFSYTRPWGLSRITAADQARFFKRLDDYLPRMHEGYAHYLLSHIVVSQRWGIPQAKPDGWKLLFKGGWGSGTGWVCHQVAVLKDGRRQISVAILIGDSPSHAYATETLEGLARRLLRGL
ncbi:MAG TPA: serine hydrolase [Actinomycetota bacterium]|nr:serine hydrolase [Actinomycetota bacterium]